MARTQLIKHDGEVVAVAGPSRVFLVPAIAELPDGDPLKRIVALKCLYKRDVDTGAVPGPYSDADAETYARAAIAAELPR